MNIETYYHDILMPANVAVSAIRRAGLPIDIKRVNLQRDEWLKEIKSLETFVEGESAKSGVPLKYSEKHNVSPAHLAEYLYSASGLSLPIYGYTENDAPSTDDSALSNFASISVPWPTDDDYPNNIVKAILQIRSLAKGSGTYLTAFERTRRADGCSHPKFNWALRTSRLSAEDPPVHQIPERADKRVADAIKACIVPRCDSAPLVEIVEQGKPKMWGRPDWDPRKHGSCFRWDIVGAEAAIRAAMLVHRFTSRNSLIAWDYLRLGKDIHSKTASLIYQVPEGTYKKGSYERDAVGKTTFFAKQFGAKWRAVQSQFWKKARVRLKDEKAQEIVKNFDLGYPELGELYLIDQDLLGRLGYAEDGYGRRRTIPLPTQVFYEGNGVWSVKGYKWKPADDPDFLEGPRELKYKVMELEHCFHVMANTPTQSMNATDNLWMLALCYHGEYLDLAVPPMWEADGIPYPEAKEWALHEGPGPGGKPMLAWHMNTVHDSGWGDCAPGYLEATAKLIWRRCRALPFDWRLQADVPYRVDFSVGPDMATLMPYNKIAKQFGLEPLIER